MYSYSINRVVAPAVVSAGSFTVSAQPHLVVPMNWFQNTLPIVQWIAALMAALSGAFAVWSYIERKLKKG